MQSATSNVPPVRSRVLRDVAVQLAVVVALFVLWHLERAVDRFARLGRVPRVDNQGTVQGVRCERARVSAFPGDLAGNVSHCDDAPAPANSERISTP